MIHAPLLEAAARRLDQACDRFEAACLAGPIPALEPMLAEFDEPEQPAALRELLSLELDYRRRAGQVVSLEELVRRLPQHRAVVEAVFAAHETEPSVQAGEATRPEMETASVAPPPQPSPARGEGATGSPAAGEAAPLKELTDFLAPAEGPGELGRLGGYRVLKVLGAGGMGVVFQAEDVQLQRPVALKVMKPSLAASDTARQRFIREARAAAAIEHDHIVTIYQVGQDRNAPFIAMQFLKGQSLEDRLKVGPRLSALEIARIGREIAQGLAIAHARGLVHRDIKPANVWLEVRAGSVSDGPRQAVANASEVRAGSVSDGPRQAVANASGSDCYRVKLLDFGLARAADSDAHLTQSGVILGTPAYMSPEQASGETVDHRTDLFSLGAVLYRLATGKQPFTAPSVPALLLAVTTQTPKPIRDLEPDLPPALEQLVQRLLAKTPDDRPASAREVVEVLAAIERELDKVTRWQGDKEKHDKVTRWQGDKVKEQAPTVTLSPCHRVTLSRIAIAAALLLALLPLAWLFAPTLLRFATNKGELVVQVDDPNVEVTVKQGDLVVIDKTNKREFVLAAGDGEVEVFEKASGLKLTTKKFTLTRGGKETVVVTPAELAKATDADRKAAEWVLSIGGKNYPWPRVTVRVGGNEQDIAAGKDLPAATFQLVAVNLSQIPEMTDAALQRLKGLNNLRDLRLHDTPIGNAGVENLKDLTSLTHLHLSRTRVTDAGLEHLKGLSNLQQLNLEITQVSDAGLEQLKALPKLRLLVLNGTTVSNDGLRHLKDFTTLGQLLLSGTQVSDAGLVHLDKLRGLTLLHLIGTKVTAAGVAELQKALPKCQITWDGNTDPDRRAAEWVLSVGGPIRVRVNDAVFRIRGGAELPKDRFQLIDVGLGGNPQVSDVGLAQFKDCKNLTDLYLHGTAVTDVGLEYFKDCKNLMILCLYTTRVSDAGMAHFRDCKNLTHLLLDGTRVSDAGMANFKDCNNLIHLGLR